MLPFPTDETVQIAFRSVRKGGTMLMVGVGAMHKKTMPIDPYILAIWRKNLVGVLFGDSQFQTDIPRYIDLFEKKEIDLDSMVTKEIRLDDINQAIDDIFAGNKVARSVIRFD